MAKDNTLLWLGAAGLGGYILYKSKSAGAVPQSAPAGAGADRGPPQVARSKGSGGEVLQILENTEQGVNFINDAVTTGRRLISGGMTLDRIRRGQEVVLPDGSRFTEGRGTISKLPSFDDPVFLGIRTGDDVSATTRRGFDMAAEAARKFNANLKKK